MSYVSFRGASTASLTGVAVSVMPSHKKAAMRYTEYYVKGRDGALHVDEGLANFDIQVTLVLLDASAATRQLVNAWADGTGKLITSDDPARAYRATVKQEIQWKRVRGNTGYFDTAKITFNCEPYMYEAVETVLTFTADGQIVNGTSATALPLIVVEGSGDVTFSVAGEEITIAGMTTGVPVYIDSETGYVWAETGDATMTGNFPEIPMGTSDVEVGSGITKITVTPHWRWI